MIPSDQLDIEAGRGRKQYRVLRILLCHGRVLLGLGSLCTCTVASPQASSLDPAVGERKHACFLQNMQNLVGVIENSAFGDEIPKLGQVLDNVPKGRLQPSTKQCKKILRFP